MADKNKIEIDIRATGGAAAAKEVEEVEEAIDSTGKSADDLVREALDRTEKKFQDITDGLDAVEESFDHGTGAVEKTGESMEKTGKKAGGLMGWLKGVGGSMIAAFSAANLLDRAVGAVANSIARTIAKQDEMLRSAAQAGPEIVRTHLETAAAMERLPSAAEAAATALQSYFTAVDASSNLARQQATDAAALAAARREEADAVIALREARGEIDGEEAREERRQLAIEARITEHERELDLLKQIEVQEQKKAEAAERVLAAAQAEVEAALADEGAFVGAGGDRNRGEQVDAALTQRVAELRIARDRAQRELDELNTFAGATEAGNEEIENLREQGTALDRVNPGMAALRLIQAHLHIRDRIAQAEEEADRVAQELEKAQSELQRKLAERDAELKERLATAQANAAEAEQLAREAGVGASSAGDAVERKETVGREIVDTESRASEIAAEAQRTAAAQKEQERIAAEEAARAQQEQDAAAAQVADDIFRTAQSAAAGTGSKALVDTLNRAAEALADGTDNDEVVSVASRLAAAAEQLSGRQQAAIRSLEQQVRDLESRTRNNQ